MGLWSLVYRLQSPGEFSELLRRQFQRVKRGLFQTNTGILLNADINGSGNILRKVVGDTWLSQPIVDLMLNPVKRNFCEETFCFIT